MAAVAFGNFAHDNENLLKKLKSTRKTLVNRSSNAAGTTSGEDSAESMSPSNTPAPGVDAEEEKGDLLFDMLKSNIQRTKTMMQTQHTTRSTEPHPLLDGGEATAKLVTVLNSIRGHMVQWPLEFMADDFAKLEPAFGILGDIFK